MPPEATGARLRRLMVLVPWIMAQGAPRIDVVCERFGISRKELQADLNLLFVCGSYPFGPGDLIEVAIDDDRVSITTADALAQPPRLTRGEALGLLVVGRALARLPGLEEAESLRRALDKIEATLAPGDADAATALAGRMEVELETPAAGTLTTLRDAVAGCERLEIEYYTESRRALGSRRIDPLLLYTAGGIWYVVAHDHRSGERRVFRVDRIKSLAPVGETFTRPDDFSPEEHANRPLVTPTDADRDVSVEVGPRGAWVAEVVPHDGAEPLDDGWTRIRLRTAHFAWLVRLLMSLGGQARAVEPDALAEEVRSAAAAALARYEASGS